MSKALQKGYIQPEPYLDPSLYSLRGIIGGFYCLFLLVVARIFLLFCANLAAFSNKAGVIGSYHAISINSVSIWIWPAFLLFAWSMRSKLAAAPAWLLRFSFILAYLLCAIFPSFLGHSGLTSAALWVMSLLELIILWSVAIYMMQWLPKFAMFVYLPVLMVLLPSAAGLNWGIHGLMRTHIAKFMPWLLVMGLVVAILLFIILRAKSPYAPCKGDKTKQPWAPLQMPAFWVCFLLIVVAESIRILLSNSLSHSLLLHATNYLQQLHTRIGVTSFTATIYAFGAVLLAIIFLAVKKRIAVTRILFAAGLVCALVFAFVATGNIAHDITYAMLMLACSSAAYLAYGYWFDSAWQDWPWCFAVLFVFSSLAYGLLHAIFGWIATGNSHLSGKIILLGLFVVLSVLSFLMQRYLQSESAAAIGSRKTFLQNAKCYIQGRISLARTFWGLGAYVIACSTLIKVAALSFDKPHKANLSMMPSKVLPHAYTAFTPASFVASLAHILLASFWVVSVWRSCSASSLAIKLLVRIYGLMIIIAYIGAFIQTLKVTF